VRFGGTISGIAILMTVLVGCATVETGAPPRVMQPGDFKMLAGKWTGSTFVQQQGSLPIEAVIEETGAFYFRPMGAAAGQTAGQMRIVNGGVVYEAATSKGTMTFQEAANGWVWKWQGKSVGGGNVQSELTKPK
jgi:hypothetical protein